MIGRFHIAVVTPRQGGFPGLVGRKSVGLAGSNRSRPLRRDRRRTLRPNLNAGCPIGYPWFHWCGSQRGVERRAPKEPPLPESGEASSPLPFFFCQVLMATLLPTSSNWDAFADKIDTSGFSGRSCANKIRARSSARRGFFRRCVFGDRQILAARFWHALVFRKLTGIGYKPPRATGFGHFSTFPTVTRHQAVSRLASFGKQGLVRKWTLTKGL